MSDWNCTQKDPYGPVKYQWGLDETSGSDDHVAVELWIADDRLVVRGMAHVAVPLWLIGELTCANSARTAAKRLRKENEDA